MTGRGGPCRADGPRRRFPEVGGTGPRGVSALTGLRAAAALAIVAFHYAGGLAALPEWAERVRAGGHVWVGLFYVLSGFVLARAHPAPLEGAARRSFWIARAARLYPAYLLAFALAAPFALERWADGGAAGAGKAALVGAASLALLHAWAPPIARLWNPPGWSTSVVASFYAAFPFAAARLSRLSTRGLRVALALAWAASLAFPLAWLALQPDGPVTDFGWGEPRWLEALKFHPVARAGEFLAGVVLGLLHARGAIRAPAGAAAPALLAVLALLAWGGVPYVLLHNGALAPLFAVVVLALVREEGALARTLSSRPAVALGDASFALYALQEPLWRLAHALVPPATERAGAPYVAVFTACACAASVAATRLLERPARRALRAALERAWTGEERPAAPRPGLPRPDGSPPAP
ncbi:MAG: acyltransferase family protein [Anaeromyxobacteraceae bacterium]